MDKELTLEEVVPRFPVSSGQEGLASCSWTSYRTKVDREFLLMFLWPKNTIAYINIMVGKLLVTKPYQREISSSL